jgi:hypothetical protein
VSEEERATALVVDLEVGSKEEKMRAVREAGELRIFHVMPNLFAILKCETESGLRSAALEALGKLAEPQAGFTIQPRSVFPDKFEHIGTLAERMDASLIPVFIDALGEGPTMRFMALGALKKLVPRSVEDLFSLRTAVVRLNVGEGKAPKPIRDLLRKTYSNWTVYLSMACADKYKSVWLPPRFRRPPVKPPRRREIGKKEVLRA